MPNVMDFSTARAAEASKRKLVTLKEQLRFYLDERGLSAAELSRKSKVSKQVLSAWMAGAKPKNVEQIRAVARVLSTTIDNLLFGSGRDEKEDRITELDTLLGNGWVGGTFELRIRRVKK
jgi:transcriptional regulator with XRE-family HTH domain